MKNLIVKTPLHKLQSCFFTATFMNPLRPSLLLLFILAISLTANACNEFGVSERNLMSPFNSQLVIKCNSSDSSTVTYKLLDETNNSISEGNQTNFNYTFLKPGSYYAVFYNNASPIAGHDGHVDKTTDTCFIEILPTSMVFNFVTLKISQAIRKGISTDGITVTVQADVLLYKGNKTKYKPMNMKTAGVGSRIIGTAAKQYHRLRSGANTLTYNLSGLALEQAYIMMDFTDINGMVQSYSLLTEIK